MLQPKVVRVVIAAILVLQWIEFCESLKKGDKGVCEDSVAIKGQNAEMAEAELTCCLTYEYDAEEDKCIPICSQGCKKGTCVDVDVCVCKPPLILVDFECIEPTCSNCEHGTCIGQNNCKCHANYLKLNDTCVPICEQVCVNGHCAAPNTCECNTGYTKDLNDGNKCNPICDHECINGRCASPNKCSCDVGYEPTDNKTVCKPSCYGCEYGECIAPNNCICFEEYERINSTCKPKCSACNNGDCVAPEKCQCPKDYALTAEGCTPICSPPCNNGHCVKPGECSCNDGYNLTKAGCQSYCSKSCINGHCAAPENCSCNDGYQKNETDSSRCYKPCNPPCLNGICSLDGKCNCNADYEFDTSTKKCTPIKYMDCYMCDGKCNEDKRDCRCANLTRCINNDQVEIPAGVVASDELKLAGMNVTLMAIGGACLLLLILVVVVMQRIWHKRNDYDDNKPTNDHSGLGSVVYTVPHTLIHHRASAASVDNESSYDEDANTDRLLRRDTRLP